MAATQLASVAGRKWSHGDPRRQGRAQREARTAHIEQHRVASIDDADIRPLAQSECPQTTGLVGRTLDVHNGRPTPSAARGQRARARRYRYSELFESGERFGGHEVR